MYYGDLLYVREELWHRLALAISDMLRKPQADVQLCNAQHQYKIHLD
jgi:hypothetical protein